jgi:hypothetical protein
LRSLQFRATGSRREQLVRRLGAGDRGPDVLGLDRIMPAAGTDLRAIAGPWSKGRHEPHLGLAGLGVLAGVMRVTRPRQQQAGEFAVAVAAPGTGLLLMTGQPYGQVPVFNGPYVDEPPAGC